MNKNIEVETIMSPALSIVIPAYNSSKTIAKCIESIEKNSNKNFEIVIIDDGSTDNQNDIISKYMDEYSNIRLISQDNTGCVGARLKGFVSSNGTYCTTVDADDCVSEEYVENILKLAGDNPDIDMFFLNNFRNDNGPEDFSVEREMTDEYLNDKSECLSRVWFKQEGAIWNKIFKTEYFDYCEKILSEYKKITFAEDLIINSAYLSNPMVRNIQFKNIAVYYHYEQFGVTGSVKFTPKKLINSFDRTLFLGGNVFGRGLYDRKIESEVFYWNLRYLIYQLIGAHKLKKDNLEKKQAKEIYFLSNRIKCFTIKQKITRLCFAMIKR